MTDNGPQFDSREFEEFTTKFGIKHETSSPRYPQANGQAERAVQTMKNLMKKSTEPYLALLSYRTTPLAWCNRSPAELLMGRKLRTTLPVVRQQLILQWSCLKSFRKSNDKCKQQQKTYYDQRHSLPELAEDTPVWITTDKQKSQGTVTRSLDCPRSLIVSTSTGELRRNRRHLNAIPQPQEQAEQKEPESLVQTQKPDRSPIMTRSRTGTLIILSERLY